MKREEVLAILAAYQERLKVLGCAVDLGTEDALREHLREPVLKEAIRAF